jgi:hypothetical protein
MSAARSESSVNPYPICHLVDGRQATDHGMVRLCAGISIRDMNALGRERPQQVEGA